MDIDKFIFDINVIINRNIEKAYRQGRADMAQEIVDICKGGKTISEWCESRDEAIELCFKEIMRI